MIPTTSKSANRILIKTIANSLLDSGVLERYHLGKLMDELEIPRNSKFMVQRKFGNVGRDCSMYDVWILLLEEVIGRHGETATVGLVAVALENIGEKAASQTLLPKYHSEARLALSSDVSDFQKESHWTSAAIPAFLAIVLVCAGCIIFWYYSCPSYQTLNWETPIFVGRETDLQKLENATKNHTFSNRTVVVLSGIGGIGKTELARHFAQNVYRDRRWTTLWFSASELVIARDTLITQSRKLNVPHENEQLKDIVEGVFRKLSVDKCRILVVLDDVREVIGSMLEVMLTFISSNDPGSIRVPLIVVTTTNQNLIKGDDVIIIKVTELNDSSAKKVLETNKLVALLGKESTSALDEIVVAAAGHPLLIHQMVAFIENQHELSSFSRSPYRLADFLHDYFRSDNTRSLVQSHPLSPSTHCVTPHEPLSSMFAMTVSHLGNAKDGDSALLALRLVAYLHPSRIKPQIIEDLAWILNSSQHPSIHAGIRLLSQLSYCNVQEDIVSVHRVVQDLTRQRLPLDRVSVLQIMNYFLEKLNGMYEKFMLRKKPLETFVMLHAFEIWRHGIRNVNLTEKETGVFEIAIYKQLQSQLDQSAENGVDYEFSQFVYQTLIGIFGKSDNMTLYLAWKVGDYLAFTGRHEAAQEILNSSHNSAITLWGEGHPKTVRIRKSLDKVNRAGDSDFVAQWTRTRVR